MKRDYNRLRITLLIIVIALLVTYAFIAYIPHGHDCIDSDCFICNMINAKDKLLSNASLLSVINPLLLIIFMLPAARKRIVALCESTPVGLKVKISD